LHLNVALNKQVQLGEQRLVSQPQTPGRIRRGFRLDAQLGQLFLHVWALGLQGVDAQVQARQRIEAVGQGVKLSAHLGLQGLHQPLRQVVAVQVHEVVGPDLVAALQPFFFRQ
jgi:hypothetical protein